MTDEPIIKEPEEDARVKELTEALARAMADLVNYKRRNEEDKASFVKFANAKMLKALIPTIDNLTRTVQHLPNDLKENEWAKGILSTYSELLKSLENLGVKKVETVGAKLDLNMHEALLAGPGEKDLIIEEYEPGYTMSGEVVKPAKVKVGDGS